MYLQSLFDLFIITEDNNVDVLKIINEICLFNFDPWFGQESKQGFLCL